MKRALKLGALAAFMLALPAAASADNSPFQFAEPFQIAQASGTVQQQRSQPAPVTPPEPQKWAVAIGGLYTHREGETAGWAPNVEVNYSATDRLQLHAMAPYAYDRVAGGQTHFGIGDVETGVRYRFIDDDPNGWQPAVAFYPLVDFPTGKVSENLGTGRTHVFLPLWLSKRFGDWIPYAGGGYWINPGPLNKDWAFAALGVVRRINEQWSLTGEIFDATSSKVGLPDQAGFDVGARYNFTENHHVVVTLGRGVQNASQTNEFTGYVAYVLTF
jgi:hypothetical protein